MGEAWEGLSHLVPRGVFFVETPDMESFTVIFLVGVRTPRSQGLWPSWSQDDYRRLPQGQP